MRYEDMIFKIPVESDTYREDSDFVIRQMTNILDERKRVGDDKIIINTMYGNFLICIIVIKTAKSIQHKSQKLYTRE